MCILDQLFVLNLGWKRLYLPSWGFLLAVLVCESFCVVRCNGDGYVDAMHTCMFFNVYQGRSKEVEGTPGRWKN